MFFRLIVFGFLLCDGVFGQGLYSANFFDDAVSSEAYALAGNPSGLVSASGLTIVADYGFLYQLKQLSNKGMSIVIPVSNMFVAGLAYRSFGYSLMKQERMSAALARKFGKKVYAGASLEYLPLSFGNPYGHTAAITFSGGFQLFFTPSTTVGFSVFNPVKFNSAESVPSLFPIIIRSGVKHLFNEKTMIWWNLSKTDSDPLVSVIRIRYGSEKFNIHTGFSNGNSRYFFGYTFSFYQVAITMLSGYSPVTGFNPFVSLVYRKQ